MKVEAIGGLHAASRSCAWLLSLLLCACGGGQTSPPTASSGSGAPDTPSDPVVPADPPSAGNIDLSHWRLTIPADAEGGTQGEALNILPAALLGPPPYDSPWFYREASGALSFWVPVTGAIGGSSSNPRSELREMLAPPDASVNWSASQTSALSAHCTVAKVPANSNSVIVGQVHAYQSAHPLVLLQYSYDSSSGSGQLTAHVNTTPAATSTQKFPLATGVALGQGFDYELKVAAGVLTVSVNGTSAQYTLGSAWRSAGLFFKAGAYIKAGTDSTDGALVTFQSLDIVHQ